jgi:predicted RNase H-like nuclease (RuvC/YqgF family)
MRLKLKAGSICGSITVLVCFTQAKLRATEKAKDSLQRLNTAHESHAARQGAELLRVAEQNSRLEQLVVEQSGSIKQLRSELSSAASSLASDSSLAKDLSAAKNASLILQGKLSAVEQSNASLEQDLKESKVRLETSRQELHTLQSQARRTVQQRFSTHSFSNV